MNAPEWRSGRGILGWPFVAPLALALIAAAGAVAQAAAPRGAVPGGAAPRALAATTPTWSAATAPVAGLSPPAGAPIGNGEVLGQISCPAKGWCVAVGRYTDTSNDQLGLIETLSAGTWTPQSVPVSGLSPVPVSNVDAVLSSVSCPARGSCTAVGAYTDQAFQAEGLIATLSGGTWTAQTAPLPTAGLAARMFAVSCSAPGACVAVGWYGNPDGPSYGLIDTLAAGTWTAQAVPTSGLNPAPAASPRMVLDTVSCPAAGWCVATGLYPSVSNQGLAFFATLSGGAWSATTAPTAELNPPPAANPVISPLYALSCAAAGACVVAGSYQTATSRVGLIETLADGTWTGQSAPVAGLNPAPGTSKTDSQAIADLTCQAPGACVITGSYDDTAGDQDGFADTLANGTWHAATVRGAGLTPHGHVYRMGPLSCPAPGSCVAFGAYYDPEGYGYSLIATLSHGAWTTRTGPGGGLTPPSAYPVPTYLDSMACPATGSCFAVGLYFDTAGSLHGLIETLGTARARAPGYWLAAASGRAYSFGAWSYPKPATLAKVVGIAASGPGYLLADRAGRVYSVNGGSVCSPPAAATTVTGIATDPATGGYWLATTAGHVYPCDAPAYGSLAAKKPASPVVGIAADGAGYLLVTANGTVHAFHTASHGSLTRAPRSRVTGIAADPATRGYWLVTAAGNVYPFDAPRYGSLAGKKLPSRVVGIAADGDGYLLVTATGKVYAFHTHSYGSLPGSKIPSPVIGVTATG